MLKLITVLSLLFVFTASNSQRSPDDISQVEKKNFLQLRTADSYSVSSNNFDVNFYRCEWYIDPAVRKISGTVTSYFTLTSASNSITYDLSSILTVDSVIMRGNKISFNHAPNNALQIIFPATIAGGQKDSVSIFYKGIPPNTGFGSFNMTTHNGTPVLWTLSEPYGAPTWWPCKDVTSDKPDSIDIIITNPSQYISSSNGLPVSEVVNGGNRTIHWKHRYPIATYLVALAITNYNINQDVAQLPGRTMPVVMYAYPENAAAFQPAVNVAKFCLQAFSNLLTEYPFAKERYAQTQFGWGGGMEHQTNSFIVNANSGLVAHELAHQWFGDKITCGSWQDLWLNEGAATYMEYIYIELSNPAGKLPQLQTWTNSITSNPSGSVFVPDTTILNRLFDSRLTYRKGAYLHHMLRWKLGDSIYFRGIRKYLNDPALVYRHARTVDLERNLETESGQTLTEFFKDWFYGEGYPNYEAVWNQNASNVVRLQLNQTQSHTSVSFFEMPVPIQFKNATRDTIIRVNHSSNGQIYTLNPGFAADTVIIDPQLWILSKIKTAKKIQAPVSSGINIYPNPVRNQFLISYPNNFSNLQVRVFNSLGQLMTSRNVISSSSEMNIDAVAWPSGMYWLHVSGSNFNQTKKFLVLKN